MMVLGVGNPWVIMSGEYSCSWEGRNGWYSPWTLLPTRCKQDTAAISKQEENPHLRVWSWTAQLPEMEETLRYESAVCYPKTPS